MIGIMTLSYRYLLCTHYCFILNSVVFLCIDIDLAAHPDLLQDTAPLPIHHLVASADTRIPAPALILGAVAVPGLDHIPGLPLTGLTTGTLVAGENCCALYGFLPKLYNLCHLPKNLICNNQKSECNKQRNIVYL